MRRWTLAAAASALLGAALWHFPATAQRAAPSDHGAPPAAQAAPTQSNASGPTATDLITFDEYRDFRLRDIAQRSARLARELAAPNLSASETASLERRKAYYDQLAAMPAAERDRIFRARFDQIDTDHDGTLDAAERAVWRDKQRAHYRELAATRSNSEPSTH